MVELVVKVLVALTVALVLYLAGATVVRSFSAAPPDEDEPPSLETVHYRYQCSICGTEVTMTAAPQGEVPDAPRHCREDMSLVIEGGLW